MDDDLRLDAHARVGIPVGGEELRGGQADAGLAAAQGKDPLTEPLPKLRLPMIVPR